MIKRIKILATGALLLAGLGACSPSGKKTGADSTVDTLRTTETVNLLNNLRKVPTQGIMFGHMTIRFTVSAGKVTKIAVT